jgi:aspartyl-tRNA(Asn)/glutamyl-tRNA(Gln) amidotransferase subunit A
MKEFEFSIETINQMYNSGDLKPSEVIETVISNIDSKDEEVKAYLSVFKEEMQKKATELDAKQKKGEKLTKLEGIPMSVKDAILIKGHKATSSAKILENYTATYDATVINRLRESGIIFTGKTNLDEFAMGSSTENSAFQKTTNPHDKTKVPGGSSGGSAASVAAKMAVVSIGSDTGGSIRQPASFCGITGLKPTYGRVSRSGLMAMASSLDQVGPFANSALDCAYILDAMEGQDDLDATSVSIPASQKINFEYIKDKDIAGMKIGISKEMLPDDISPEIKEVMDQIIEFYKSKGVIFEDIELPYTKYGIPTYYILMPAEVSSNLSRFDGIRYGLSKFDESDTLQEMYQKSRTQGFGEESKRRIMLGAYVLSSGYYDAYYTKAKQVQQLIRNDFKKAYQKVDAILCPTSPHTAFGLGEKIDDPLSMYLEDMFTIPANIAGITAISVPVQVKNSLPIGFQLMGNHFEENIVLKLSHSYQSQK